ncbi:hypothetical protein WEH80_16445 [Actinomycetes bacterium KLBMP 9759]
MTRLIAAVGTAAIAVLVAAAPADATEVRTDVPGCETGCEVVFDEQLPDDVGLVGLRTTDRGTGLQRGLLAYYVSGQLHDYAEPVELGALGDATCGYDGDAQRCLVSYAVGAHGTTVVALHLTYTGGIQVTDEVGGGTPESVLSDLDGNGRADASIRESTYEPAYAAAPRFWQTFLEFDGRFVRTGCGPTTFADEPAPAAPLYGKCEAT